MNRIGSCLFLQTTFFRNRTRTGIDTNPHNCLNDPLQVRYHAILPDTVLVQFFFS